MHLNFHLFSSQSGHEVEAKIGKNIENANDSKENDSKIHNISSTELAAFPPFPFLRFDSVYLSTSYSYFEDDWHTQPIAAKCQFIEDQLKLIKPALDDTILFLDGVVNEDDSSCFADHSELLNYFRSQLLTACDGKPRGYWIQIGLCSDESDAKYVLTSLFQMPQIICCSDVRIKIYATDEQMKLPIKEISNWLHQKHSGRRDRSLRIYLNERIVGIEEMVALLKTVRVNVLPFK